MAEAFTIRVQSDDGNVVLSDLTASSSIEELKSRISAVLNLPIGSFNILYGYPPELLLRENMTLDAAGINSGEVLRIRRIENFAPPQTPSELQVPARPVLDSTSSGDLSIEGMPRPFHAGTMLRVDIPSNNSCLFLSMQYVLTGGQMNLQEANNLRSLIAHVVARDPETYNEAFLEMSNADYCTWIQNPNHWGGAIELSILSDYYGIEIVAVDIANLRQHRFGENRDYKNRVFLLYDGIHYEPLVLDSNAEDGLKQTMFSTTDDYAVVWAQEVAQEAKSSRQFVDPSNFTVRCCVCHMGLRGEREAREHAANTRHRHFAEVLDLEH